MFSNTHNTPISIIVAMARNYVIGKNNSMPWHITEDFRWFKKITLGHTLIMGKNTFLSLPIKPLPNRRNVVITHDNNFYWSSEIEIVHSLDEAIDIADRDKENFVIGGGEIYKQFLPIANKLYVTFIDEEFEGDTFFPEININEWELNEINPQQETHPLGLKYEFRIYLRK